MDAGKPPAGRPAKPIGVGMILIGSELVAFALAGIAVDYLAGTRGGFTAAGTLIGMVAAVALATRLLREESGPDGPA